MDLRESRSLALLFITHDLGLAWALCDRIAVMYLGRIVEHGSAEQVIERPRHPYTQALVAAVPSPGREEGAKLIGGEPPDAAHIPPGCRLHPRCPLQVRAVRQRGPGAVRRRGRGPPRGLPAPQDTITVRLCSRMNCVR